MEYGIPVKSAMTMFRIKSVQTLGRYSHPSEQHLRAEFNKLNGQRPANAAEKPSKTPIINDTEDRKGRLRDKLEEAYVLGNIDKEAYDEGMRRIEELATDQ
jgi:hypothetical protein